MICDDLLRNNKTCTKDLLCTNVTCDDLPCTNIACDDLLCTIITCDDLLCTNKTCDDSLCADKTCDDLLCINITYSVPNLLCTKLIVTTFSVPIKLVTTCSFQYNLWRPALYQ